MRQSDDNLMLDTEIVERFRLGSTRTVKTLRDRHGLKGMWRGRRLAYRIDDVKRALEQMNVSRNLETREQAGSDVQNALHDNSTQANSAEASRQNEVDKPMVRRGRKANSQKIRLGIGGKPQGGIGGLCGVAGRVDETIGEAGSKRFAVFNQPSL